MDREEAIRHIEALYPPDCDYTDTAKIGNDLLELAKKRLHLRGCNWKDEATPILVELANLSITYDSMTKEQRKYSFPNIGDK